VSHNTTQHYATQHTLTETKRRRDYCAHVLIPLNACRQEHFYLPWKCTHERHVYEACQYREWLIRVGNKNVADKAAAAAAGSK
jgi:NADH dehydrogenase (ubiquinone) 1 beta subcomplex subunit 7